MCRVYDDPEKCLYSSDSTHTYLLEHTERHQKADKETLDNIMNRLRKKELSYFISPEWKAKHEPARYLVQWLGYRRLSSYLIFCTLTLSHTPPGTDAMASGRSDNFQLPKPSTASSSTTSRTRSTTKNLKKAKVKPRPARYLVQWYTAKLPDFLHLGS